MQAAMGAQLVLGRGGLRGGSRGSEQHESKACKEPQRTLSIYCASILFRIAASSASSQMPISTPFFTCICLSA